MCVLLQKMATKEIYLLTLNQKQSQNTEMVLQKDLKSVSRNYPHEPAFTIEYDTAKKSASACSSLIQGCHFIQIIDYSSTTTWTMYTQLVVSRIEDEYVLLAQFVSD